MEVASALLEASKKLSGSADSSTASTCSATATWSSSMSEVRFPLMFPKYEWEDWKCCKFIEVCDPPSPLQPCEIISEEKTQRRTLSPSRLSV